MSNKMLEKGGMAVFMEAHLILLSPPGTRSDVERGISPDEMTDVKGRTWRPVERADRRWWQRDRQSDDLYEQRDFNFTDEELQDALDPGTAGETLLYNLRDRIVLDEEPYVFFLPIDVVYVNVLHIEQCFGGREEGGWYYVQETPIMSIPSSAGVAPYLEAFIKARFEDDDEGRPLSSVASRGKTIVRVEDHPGRLDPVERPRYE